MVLSIVGFILATLFGGWMFSFVVEGVRTGRIRHTDSTSTYAFRTQPVLFTLVALFFTVLSIMAFYLAVQRAFDVWRAIAA